MNGRLRIFVSLLALVPLVLILVCIPGLAPEAAAAEVTASGTCGDNLTWELSDDGTLTISGTGVMGDYSSSIIPWYKHKEAIVKVVIEEGVTSVGPYAFEYCSNLMHVALPDSLTDIGSYAFCECRNLADITIPANVTNIGFSAFFYCSDMSVVSFVGGAPTIGSYAFSGVTAAVYYPGGDASWNESNMLDYGGVLTWSAVANAIASGTCGDNLTWELTDDGVLTVSGMGTMDNYNSHLSVPWYSDRSSVLSVVIRDGVTGICNDAFYGCENLTDVSISNTVTDIGRAAFYGCSSLTQVVIPDGVTFVGESAFAACTGLNAITVADSVSRIGGYAFEGCTNITDIYLNSISAWVSVTLGNQWSNPMAVGSANENIYINGQLVTQVEIPEGVESIADYAFFGCTSLVEITMPDSLTAIGRTAFYGCGNLSDVVFPVDVSSIEPFAFYGCTSLTAIEIPAGLSSIAYSTFCNCSNLESVVLPASVTSIDFDAFSGCSSLSEVFYSGTEEQWGQVSIADGNEPLTAAAVTCSDTKVIIASGTCGLHATWVLDEEGTLTISGTGPVYGWYSTETIPWGDYRDSILSIVVEEGITEIGYQTFFYCKAATSITLPSTVRKLDTCAFVGCRSLQSITIPEGVEELPGYVFDSCVSLTTVYIPGTMDEISSVAFFKCSSLREIWFGGTRERWEKVDLHGMDSFYPDALWIYADTAPLLAKGSCGDNLYWALTEDGVLTIYGTGKMKDSNYASLWHSYIDSVKSVVIKNGATSIGAFAFYECEWITDITIPDTVTTVGKYAFSICKRISRIDIPAGVTSIGEYAFRFCLSLEQIIIPEGVTALEESVFEDCLKVKHISVPEGVTSIGYRTFAYCDGLVSMTLPESLKSIDDYAFHETDLLHVAYAGTQEQWSGITVGYGKKPTGADVFHYETAESDLVWEKDCVSWEMYCPACDLTVAQQEFSDAWSHTRQGDVCTACAEVLVVAGETACLEGNTVLPQLTVPAEVTLDLNGYTLAVDSLASFGDIIDSSEGSTGALAAGEFVLTDNTYLPLYDSAEDVYRFYEYIQRNMGTQDGDGSVVFGFGLGFAKADAYRLLAESEDALLTVTMTLSWGENSEHFVFSPALIRQYAALQTKYPAMRAAMLLTVTGIDTLESGTALTVTPGFTAVSGQLDKEADPMTYTAP